MYTLPQLPYGYDALEPVIGAKTMEIHHSKHHQAYIDKLNAALASLPELAALPVEKLISDLAAVPESARKAVQNHGGGHANHSLFWTVLGKTDASSPEGELADAITSTFGSFDAFKTEFATAAAGQFGSGWGWLVVTKAGELEIMTTANQDSPLMVGKMPIFGVDVWEHAYYLNYQNRRPDYLTAIWEVVNWAEVERRYTVARGDV
jgi:Fe-Mn family superoxide dismutase